MNVLSKEDGEVTIDILALLKALWNHVILIAICTVAAALLAFLITKLFIPETYRAKITMYVNNRTTEGAQSITSADLTAAAKLVDTYTAIIKSEKVMSETIREAGVDMKTASLRKIVTTSAVNNTEVFDLYVTDTSKERAAALANAIADVSPAIIMEIVEGSSVKVIDDALVPTERYSPSYSRNLILGALIGFVAACAVVIVITLLDDTVKSTADFEGYKYPMLAVIPNLDEKEESGRYGYGYGYRRKNTAKTAERETAR
ncbi:MAG: hypothetical protein ILP12_06760 [Lachnospiraceae bacterium]|nr:hypothetical protein [Lachnospiraceae bacterium]